MIFDQFCGLVERHIPAAIRMLKGARIFEFPDLPHEALPKEHAPEQLELFRESFFLPFPAIAIEDPVSCVILMDRVKDQEGFGEVRYFAECLPMDRQHLERADRGRPGKEMLDDLPPSSQGVMQISFGRLTEFNMESTTCTHLSGVVDKLIVADRRRVFSTDVSLRAQPTDANLHLLSEITMQVLTNVKTAVEEVMYFNTPHRFVVERRPAKVRSANPNTKIPRSDARPRYVLLSRDELERVFPSSPKETSGARGPRIAHRRRRHFRTLHSDKFKEARGKTITIPATWVGPEEALVGESFYKVMVDL